METSYQDICRAKSVSPKTEILKFLESKSSTLQLNFPISENDFFCILCVLQENLEYLTTLSIEKQEFSSVHLNLLTKLFKVATHIKRLSIINSMFPTSESFCLFCNSLQNNSSLQSVNFSSNGLTDNYGIYICDLIIHSSSLKEIILDSNLFKNTDFGQCFAVSAVETVSISQNPLAETVVFSVIASSKTNVFMKSLGIQGKMAQGKAFEEKVAEVLESNRLVKLSFDLSLNSEDALRKIEKALVFKNKTLVAIESEFIDWMKVMENHPAFNIKKALLANMWFYSRDMKNSIIPEDIFKEVQLLILKKMKNNEKGLNVDREIAGTPDFKENTGKSSYEISKLVSNSGSFIYSDSSFIETKERPLNLDEKNKFETWRDVKDLINSKLEKISSNFTENVSLISQRVEEMETLNQSLHQNLEEKLKIFENRLQKSIGVQETLEKNLEELEKNLSKSDKNTENKVKSDKTENIVKIEEIISTFQEKIDKNSDHINELEMKLEKQYFHVKSTFKKLNSIYVSQTQFQVLESKQETLFSKQEELLEKHLSKEESFQNLSTEIHSFSKTFQIFQKTQNENEKKLKEIISTLSMNEEKMNNALKIREILKTRDEELYQKIFSLECDILELKNLEKSEKILKDLQRIDLKLVQIEEISQKNQENNFFQFTEQNLLITELQQKIISEAVKSQTSEDRPQTLEVSASEMNSILQKPSEKFDFSKGLIGRLEKLEKMNIHKKALELTKDFEDDLDFIPGQAENLVRNAVLDKVSKLSGKNNSMVYRTLAPATTKNISSFDEEIGFSRSFKRENNRNYFNY